VSPVEQYTIDCEYLAYYEPKTNSFFFLYKRDIMQLFSAYATMHRGRKGIFNYFSEFSKLIFDLSGLIDQNESENSNFIP
jgi:hypothetical protein